MAADGMGFGPVEQPLGWVSAGPAFVLMPMNCPKLPKLDWKLLRDPLDSQTVQLQQALGGNDSIQFPSLFEDVLGQPLLMVSLFEDDSGFREPLPDGFKDLFGVLQGFFVRSLGLLSFEAGQFMVVKKVAHDGNRVCFEADA